MYGLFVSSFFAAIKLKVTTKFSLQWGNSIVKSFNFPIGNFHAAEKKKSVHVAHFLHHALIKSILTIYNKVFGYIAWRIDIYFRKLKYLVAVERDPRRLSTRQKLHKSTHSFRKCWNLQLINPLISLREKKMAQFRL